MKRIIFHIGTPKTASTTIQQTLVANRQNLQAQGVLYPIMGRGLAHPSKHQALIRALAKGEEAVLAERDILLEAFEKSGCETMVLSEEFLCWTDPERMGLLKHFAEDCQLEAVCLLRRQDIFLESMWNQLTKNDRITVGIETYCRKPRIRKRMLYDQALDAWADFSKVTALSYDAAKVQGVMSAFCQATDLPDIPETWSRNISPSAHCILALSEIKRAGLEVDMDLLAQAFQGDRSRHMLGHRLRHVILDEVADSNRRLEDKYGVRFGTDLPDEQEQPLTSPDPQAMAQAVAWLLEKEGQGANKGASAAASQAKPSPQLLATLCANIAPSGDPRQQKPLAVGKLARAIWNEETRDENLSPQDREARWQESKRDKVKIAGRVLKQLNNLGLSLVKADT